MVVICSDFTPVYHRALFQKIDFNNFLNVFLLMLHVGFIFQLDLERSWLEWGSWGNCVGFRCQDGIQTRTRTCQNKQTRYRYRSFCPGCRTEPEPEP